MNIKLGLTCVIVICATNIHAEDILSFTRLSDNPMDRELSNAGADSELAQGVATGAGFVYYTNKNAVWRMNETMTTTSRSFALEGASFSGATCAHIGGVDVFEGEVYVAIDECSDNVARLAVLNTNLELQRHARLPVLEHAFAWVSVNPLDPDYFYAVAPDFERLFAFRRDFSNNDELLRQKSIRFAQHPSGVLVDFWRQGGDFSENGLFFRVVDEGDVADSEFSGIWVYELPYPITDGVMADRVGLINIKYDPDIWAPGCWLKQCYRNYELEDLDSSSLEGGPFSSDLHVVMLSNELDEDDVSIIHYNAGDFDGDSVGDTVDNCFRINNVAQIDLDRNGVGLKCDRGEIGRILVPLIMAMNFSMNF